tara:strand:+ start:6810 stop:7091 length:282 start_codon:yes stop_codon:yes gene_type:complete
MCNHYHLLLHIDEQKKQLLSDEQVCQRWGYFYSMPTLGDRWLTQQTMSTVSTEENLSALKIINGWLDCIADISWFMRCLNKFIARKAFLICPI